MKRLFVIHMNIPEIPSFPVTTKSVIADSTAEVEKWFGRRNFTYESPLGHKAYPYDIVRIEGKEYVEVIDDI